MGEFRRATGDLRSTFETTCATSNAKPIFARLARPRPPVAAPAATEPENSIAGGLPAALPLSTAETSDAVDPASAPSDPAPDAMPDTIPATITNLAPPPGTVQSARPNASAFHESAPATPQQLDFESQQPHASDPAATEPDQNRTMSDPAQLEIPPFRLPSPKSPGPACLSSTIWSICANA